MNANLLLIAFAGTVSGRNVGSGFQDGALLLTTIWLAGPATKTRLPLIPLPQPARRSTLVSRLPPRR